MSTRCSKKAKTNGNSSKANASSSKSKEVAPSSSQRPLPHIIPFKCTNNTEKAVAEELKSRTLIPTKFYCKKTCSELGIDAMVESVAAGLGWSEFLTISSFSYPRVVIEFIATFKMERDTKTNKRHLSFRLFNKEYSTTLSALNKMFGWDPELVCVKTDDLLDSKGPWGNFDPTQFWHRITEETFVPTSRNAKATSIVHPGLRYFHRLLVQALFSRKEIGHISHYKLLLLWLATDGNTPSTPKPNFGYILCQRFVQLNKGAQSWSDILLGGIITNICVKLGADPPALCTDPAFRSPKGNLLGITELRRALFLRLTKRWGS